MKDISIKTVNTNIIIDIDNNINMIKKKLLASPNMLLKKIPTPSIAADQETNNRFVNEMYCFLQIILFI